MMELIPTSLEKARGYTEGQLAQQYKPKMRIDSVFPEFNTQYIAAQALAKHGKLKRAEMPVIDEPDISRLKTYALSGKWIGKFGVTNLTLKPSLLIPLQEQIYLEKSIGSTIQKGLGELYELLKSQHLIISEDQHIIDGHHRWLSAMITEYPVEVVRFEIPARELLKLSKAVSDKLGHVRNK